MSANKRNERKKDILFFCFKTENIKLLFFVAGWLVILSLFKCLFKYDNHNFHSFLFNVKYGSKLPFIYYHSDHFIFSSKFVSNFQSSEARNKTKIDKFSSHHFLVYTFDPFGLTISIRGVRVCVFVVRYMVKSNQYEKYFRNKISFPGSLLLLKQNKKKMIISFVSFQNKNKNKIIIIIIKEVTHLKV